MKKILLLVLVIILFGCNSCGESEPGPFRYKFVNDTGHTVAVVSGGNYKEFPDSLVLAPSDSFEWRNGSHSSFHPFDQLDVIKFYFDDTYVKTYTQFEGERNPKFDTPYVITKRGSWGRLATYTFTEEDYLDAKGD